MAHEIPTVELAAGVALPTVGPGTWQITGKSAYDSPASPACAKTSRCCPSP